MEPEVLSSIARKAGALEAALPDVLARAARQFGDTTPALADLEAWATHLVETAPHLFATPAPNVPDWLSPAERLARGHADSPPPPQPRRPRPLPLTTSELAALAQLSPTARMTRYRELQAAKGQ